VRPSPCPLEKRIDQRRRQHCRKSCQRRELPGKTDFPLPRPSPETIRAAARSTLQRKGGCPGTLALIGVATKPGHTTVTRMPLGPSRRRKPWPLHTDGSFSMPNRAAHPEADLGSERTHDHYMPFPACGPKRGKRGIHAVCYAQNISSRLMSRETERDSPAGGGDQRSRRRCRPLAMTMSMGCRPIAFLNPGAQSLPNGRRPIVFHSVPGARLPTFERNLLQPLPRCARQAKAASPCAHNSAAKAAGRFRCSLRLMRICAGATKAASAPTSAATLNAPSRSSRPPDELARHRVIPERAHDRAGAPASHQVGS